MPKYNFEKDPKRTTKPIQETQLDQPGNVFSLDDMNSDSGQDNNTNEVKTNNEATRSVGRPRKNKDYSTMRLVKHTVNRANAIQQTLGFETQDALVNAMLDRLENTLDADQKLTNEMYLKTYKAKEERKNSLQ